MLAINHSIIQEVDNKCVQWCMHCIYKNIQKQTDNRVLYNIRKKWVNDIILKIVSEHSTSFQLNWFINAKLNICIFTSLCHSLLNTHTHHIPKHVLAHTCICVYVHIKIHLHTHTHIQCWENLQNGKYSVMQILLTVIFTLPVISKFNLKFFHLESLSNVALAQYFTIFTCRVNSQMSLYFPPVETLMTDFCFLLHN